MARRAATPRHGLITGLGAVGVPIFTLSGRHPRDIDDSARPTHALSASVATRRSHGSAPLRAALHAPAGGAGGTARSSHRGSITSRVDHTDARGVCWAGRSW